MNILAVDDEELLLEALTRELTIVFPNETISSFSKVSEIRNYIRELQQNGEQLQYAFLDIKLRGITGIELAKDIKEVMPETRIIFCTGYTEYACEAYQVYALGYILKPVKADDIIHTLDHMEKEWREPESSCKKIMVQTFGNFEVFVGDNRIHFERKKAKELLAYLVDRRGAAVTTGELVAILYEDKVKDRSTTNQILTIISSLRKTLRENGIEEILIKTRNQTSIDVTRLECDAYDFFRGDVLAINSYRGEYMVNYSWAEFTNGEIMKTMNSI